MMTSERHSVVVAGAGIAGATVVHALALAGHSVHVFDKARGAGGRLATRRVEWIDRQGHAATTRLDHAALGFTASNPAFQAFVDLALRAGCLAEGQPRLGCVPLIGLLVPAAAGAALLAEPDARVVRQVVEAQLGAFAADDAARAVSYASASIQAQFGDANNFMAMVRSGYPMVVRPAAVSFFQPQVEVGTQETVTQLVQLRDREERLWKATYLLQRQTGAGWRISGCVVAAGSGKHST